MLDLCLTGKGCWRNKESQAIRVSSRKSSHSPRRTNSTWYLLLHPSVQNASSGKNVRTGNGKNVRMIFLVENPSFHFLDAMPAPQRPAPLSALYAALHAAQCRACAVNAAGLTLLLTTPCSSSLLFGAVHLCTTRTINNLGFTIHFTHLPFT